MAKFTVSDFFKADWATQLLATDCGQWEVTSQGPITPFQLSTGNRKDPYLKKHGCERRVCQGNLVGELVGLTMFVDR